MRKRLQSASRLSRREYVIMCGLCSLGGCVLMRPAELLQADFCIQWRNQRSPLMLSSSVQ